MKFLDTSEHNIIQRGGDAMKFLDTSEHNMAQKGGNAMICELCLGHLCPGRFMTSPSL
jgi:hypothetical protein